MISTHICEENVFRYESRGTVTVRFQLIYVRGMFSLAGGRLDNRDAGFNSYMCEECFLHTCTVFLFAPQVSIHICARNVSPYSKITCSDFIMFRFIYVRGMFQGMMLLLTAFWRFNSYMCGECFLQHYGGDVHHAVSTHICEGNVSSSPRITPHIGPRFNSYMCGDCFFFRLSRVMRLCVSTHICAGNVSPAGDATVAVGVVSIHICAGNVSAIRLDVVFQLIYVWGMFPGGISIVLHHVEVSIHICAGNVSSSPRIIPHIGPRFNSYMRGECFAGHADAVP